MHPLPDDRPPAGNAVPAASRPVRSRGGMVAGMDPRLDPRSYVFRTGLAADPRALASFREDEGLSQIVPLDDAAGDDALPMARIVLQVHSALDGVGLTAAVSQALAQAGIACNMVAAYHHDHVFVPRADAAAALEILRALQAGFAADDPDSEER